MATKTDPSWILDTSVAVGWFLTDEPARASSLAVRGDIRNDPSAYAVPALFYSEFVHVLTIRSARDRDFVREALDRLLRFGIRTFPLTESALMRTADWSCNGLGGYDATFVALAEDLGGSWLTAAAPAARIAGESAVLLEEWAPR